MPIGWIVRAFAQGNVNGMSPDAKLCAKASSVVYAEDVQILTCPALPGRQLAKVATITSEQTPHAGALYTDDAYLVVAFAGTSVWDEVVNEDAQIALGRNDEPCCKNQCRGPCINGGSKHCPLKGLKVNGEVFDLAALINLHAPQHIRMDIHGNQHGRKQVFITGHSLGGTRALYFGAKFARSETHRAIVHAFNPGSGIPGAVWAAFVPSFRKDRFKIAHHIFGDPISCGNHECFKPEIRVYKGTEANRHAMGNFSTADNPF